MYETQFYVNAQIILSFSYMFYEDLFRESNLLKNPCLKDSNSAYAEIVQNYKNVNLETNSNTINWAYIYHTRTSFSHSLKIPKTQFETLLLILD